MTSPQLDELFTRIDLTPVGPEERAMIDEAIRLAEEAGDERSAYFARMRLTSSAHMSGDTDAMFSSFAWCIARNEQDPERFPQEVAGNDLLFQYKWMAGRLGSNPAFSRDEVQALTDDMSRRYREAGVSQSGVLQSLVSTAVLSGDLDEAVRRQAERDLIPRDDYSHCEACVRSTDARLAQLRGDEAAALRLFDEIIEQELSCGEEPEAAQADALLALLRAGRVDDAVRHHRQSYRAARALPDGFAIIADHLVFCAVTGNAARGLAILERHLHELAKDPLDQASALHQLLAIGVVLDAVVQAGQGEALVRGSDAPRLDDILGETDGPRSAAAFAAQAWSAAAAIAAHFDERNGNDYHARLVAERRALSGERHPVPLESAVFAPSAGPQDAPQDAAGWLAFARDHYLGDEAVVADAIRRGFAADPDPEVRADLLALEIGYSVVHDDDDRASSALAEHIRVLRSVGVSAAADLEERLGLVLFGRARPDDLDALRAEESRRRAAGNGPELARVLTVIGDLAVEDGRLDEALPVLREAVELTPDRPEDGRRGNVVFRVAAVSAALGDDEVAESLLRNLADEPHFPASVRLRAGGRLLQLLLERGDAPAAIPVAEEQLRGWIALGHGPSIVDAARWAARAWSAADRDDEAAARIQYAVRIAERSELGTGDLRFELGRYQLWAGDVEDARDTFEELYRELDDESGPIRHASVLFLLGESARRTGDAELAYNAWSRAVELANDGDDGALAARAGIGLGGLLAEFRDDDAVEALADALAAARRVGHTELILEAQHALGRVKAEFGDADGPAELEAAYELAVAEGAAWLAADITDSRARALVVLGRLDEALGVFETAASAYLAAGDGSRAVGSAVAAARALVEAGRGGDAVDWYRRALADLPPGAGAHATLSEELADALDALGRSAEAHAVRVAAS